LVTIEHIGEAAFGWLQHKIVNEWAVLVTGEDWVRDYTVIRRTSQQMWTVFKERLKITFLNCWVIDQLFELCSFRPADLAATPWWEWRIQTPDLLVL
jgi:hypothetical protein